MTPILYSILITLLINLAHMPSIILRYLPFEDSLEKKQKKNLIICYSGYLLINMITTFIIDYNVGTSLIIYETNILISCIILATINITIIKGYFYQHIFIFGFVASLYLMIQAISAFIISPMDSLLSLREMIIGNTAYFLLLFILFYIPIARITRDILKTYVFKENNYWSRIWFIPNLLFVAGFFFVVDGGWVTTVLQLLTHLVLGLMTILICRTIAFDFAQMKEAETYKLELEYTRKQNALQEKYYDALSDNIETARKSRHDVKHHLNVLSGYLENNDIDGLKGYLRTYIDNQDDSEYIPFTGNSNVDALLYSYHKIIKANNIDFVVNCNLSDIGNITDVDICTLMGNAVENAIEANQHVYDNRFIKVCSVKEDDTLIITIDNSFNGKVDKRGDLFYSSKQIDRPGVGTVSMKETCEKYHGMCKFEYQDKVFYTNFLLNTNT